MVMFGILFAINIAVAMVAFGFFIVGLTNGTVTTSNILLWAAMLGTVYSVPFAAWLLRLRGHRRMGTVALLPLAALGAVAMLVLLVTLPNWR